MRRSERPSLYLIVIAELVRARTLVDQLWNRAPPVTVRLTRSRFAAATRLPALARYCAGNRWPLTYSAMELAHVVEKSGL